MVAITITITALTRGKGFQKKEQHEPRAKEAWDSEEPLAVWPKWRRPQGTEDEVSWVEWVWSRRALRADEDRGCMKLWLVPSGAGLLWGCGWFLAAQGFREATPLQADGPPSAGLPLLHTDQTLAGTNFETGMS